MCVESEESTWDGACRNEIDMTQIIRILHSKTHPEIPPVIVICNRCILNTPILKK